MDILEDVLPRSLQTPLPVPTEVPSVRSGMEAIEKGEIR